MRPFLFHIGGVGIPSFFFMIMVAMFAATWVSLRFARREKLSEVAILDLSIIAIVASMLGARIFHVLVEAPEYYWESPIRVLYFWQGGFVSLGAFIATILSWLVYLKVKKLNIAQYLDVAGNIAPVIIFFVRIGCFLNGCCYGKPATHWPSVVYDNPSSTACLMGFCHVPLYPTQAFFMLNAVVMFIAMIVVRKYRTAYGQVGAAFLMYEGVSRFFIEFLRGDDDRGVYFNGAISTGQIVMVLFFVAGLAMWIMVSKKKKHEA